MPATPATISAQLQEAVAHHRAGRLGDAERLYRRVLQAAPEQPDALRLVAGIALQTGRHSVAETFARRALTQRPDNAELHRMLAAALMERGRAEAAAQSARRALELAPDFPGARLLLGNALHASSDLEGAEREWRAVLARDANNVPTQYNLAQLLLKSGRNAEAEELLENAVVNAPTHAGALALLGQCVLPKNAQQAAGLLQRAIGLGNRTSQVYTELAQALLQQNDRFGARGAFEEAVKLDGKNVEALLGLADISTLLEQPERALELLRRALKIDPANESAMVKICDALDSLWRVDEAIAFSQTHAHRATFSSALCRYVNMSPNWSDDDIFAVHRDWGKRFTDPLSIELPRHQNDRNVARQLRIGYVSGDFRRHSVAVFLLPFLAAHDHASFEIFLYNNNPEAKDSVSQQLRGLSQAWRDIHGLSDSQAAAVIRQDAIDILIDLSGHTGMHRLETFALQPAPVQMTYLGYIDTTGMSAMQYRIVDALSDPPGEADNFHTEKLLRLAGGYLAYQPLPLAIEPVPPPMAQRGFVTFGSANSLTKINKQVLAIWARVMAQVPHSRLLLKDGRLAISAVRQEIGDFFAARDIARDRLELRNRTSGDLAHLQTYNEIDIALDPFPFNGMTTTFEALWMGVPVVTLTGQRSAGRHGVDILTRIGHRELIASDVDDYVAIAEALAGDKERLIALRAGLRSALLASSLCDGPRLAREIETVYRAAWREWCNSGAA